MTNEELLHKVAKIGLNQLVVRMGFEPYAEDDERFKMTYPYGVPHLAGWKLPDYLNSYNAIIPVIQRWCEEKNNQRWKLDDITGVTRYWWENSPKQLCESLVKIHEAVTRRFPSLV